MVPDLVGFGRSDKPKREGFHRLGWHCRVLGELATALDLARVVVVAEEGDEALACALVAALGPQARGLALLPRTAATPADALPFPNRGHAAGARAFAGGWQPVGGETCPAAPAAVDTLHLPAGSGEEQARQAVEYFGD